jgi:hypothetical protein
VRNERQERRVMLTERGTAGRDVDGQAVISSFIKDCTWLKSAHNFEPICKDLQTPPMVGRRGQNLGGVGFCEEEWSFVRRNGNNLF